MSHLLHMRLVRVLLPPHKHCWLKRVPFLDLWGLGKKRCTITDVRVWTLKNKGPAIFEDIRIYAQVHSKKCVSIGIKKLNFQNAFLQAYVSPVADSVTCMRNVQETAEKECHLLEMWLAITCISPYFIVTV